jgi:hypothetical protein
MTGGGENEHPPATALQFDEMLEVLGHDQVTDAQHPCVGTGRRERGMSVQQPPGQLRR